VLPAEVGAEFVVRNFLALLGASWVLLVVAVHVIGPLFLLTHLMIVTFILLHAGLVVLVLIFLLYLCAGIDLVFVFIFVNLGLVLFVLGLAGVGIVPIL
jgi:hypothetical protein